MKFGEFSSASRTAVLFGMHIISSFPNTNGEVIGYETFGNHCCLYLQRHSSCRRYSRVVLSGTTPADPRLSVNSTANSDLSQETPPPASSAQETAAAQTPKYRICEYEGKVAVFLAGRELPYQILETGWTPCRNTTRNCCEKELPRKTNRNCWSFCRITAAEKPGVPLWENSGF